MNLKVENNNYCATVIKIKKTINLDGLDNLVGVPIYGFQALVGKEIKEGELMLLFTAETKLSEDYLYNNNLYSSNLLNKDTEKKGYISKNGRIKAVKLRGNISSALIMPLSSLSYLGINYNQLKEGDVFDSINSIKICEKYIIPVKNTGFNNKISGKIKIFERIDNKGFPEHFSTDNYWKNENKYKNQDRLIVTQKLHGSSGRFGNVKVRIKQNFWDKIFKKQRYEYDYIAGSRRVIKDSKSSKQFKSFYDNDIWNKCLNKYKDIIPKDVIIYGEIIGWSDNKPIQKGYTYNVPKGEFELYVYRIININPDGFQIDWSRDAIKQFCNNTGMKYVPEIMICKKENFNANDLMDIEYYGKHPGTLSLSDKGTVDEGVCVRLEGINPYITKCKAPLFYEYESKQLDSGEADLETLN